MTSVGTFNGSGLNIPGKTGFWVKEISFICNNRVAASLSTVRKVDGSAVFIQFNTADNFNHVSCGER